MSKKYPFKRIFLLSCVTLSITVATLLVYTVWIRNDDTLDKTVPVKYEPLLTKLQSGTPVIVIIELNVDYQTESLLAESEVQPQRDHVESVREALLEELRPYDVEIVSVSDTWVIPFLALEINDEAALDKLLASPLVKQFDESGNISGGLEIISTPVPYP